MVKYQNNKNRQTHSHTHGLPRVISENEDYNDRLDNCIISQKQFKKIAKMISETVEARKYSLKETIAEDKEEKPSQTNENTTVNL
jgi:hypothetical protein